MSTVHTQDASADASFHAPTTGQDTVDVSLDITLQERAHAGNPVALPSGFVLQEYTIEAVLGAGGFGITYLARDAHLQCQVAIKEYLPGELAARTTENSVIPRNGNDTSGYREGLTRFLSETRVLAGFRHPNIVRVNRFFEANNTAYMVMDYEQGQPLRDWVKVHGPASEAQLRRMFAGLLDGLEQVHKAGTVHRDIKPSNIYVRDSDNSLVLLDFGSARPSTQPGSSDITSMVTPGYAPFEQYHARGAQGPWSDLYALGGVLYWLVTGHKPVEAPSRVKEDCLPPATEVAAERYSQGFLQMIDWAMAMDERERPQSVAEFRPVFLGEKPAPPPKVQAPRTGRDGDTVPVRTAPAVHDARASTTRAASPRSRVRWVALGSVGLVTALVIALVTRERLPEPAPNTPAAPKTSATATPPDKQRAATPKPSENAPTKPQAPRQFACSDLPFGLRVTCTLEGKDVIRQCAPDLKNWNHDRPGCKRQQGQNAAPF